MRFSGLCYWVKMAFYGIWSLFFDRLPNVALYELAKVVNGSRGKPSCAWVKIGKRFSRLFGCYARISRSFVLAFAPDGAKFYCPISDVYSLFKEIYLDEVYDKFFSPNDGHVVVDVGANIGVYTLKAAKNVGKQGTVVSIEPYPHTYELLIINVHMNNFDTNVIPINIAVSNFKGKKRFYLSSEPRGHSFEPISGNWIEVNVDKLDAIMEGLHLERCDLLKIDVEGHELEVLKGAKHTLKSTSKVVVAAYHEWAFKGEEEAVKKFLRARGFRNVFANRSYVYALK